jgi:hypothetical protein
MSAALAPAAPTRAAEWISTGTAAARLQCSPQTVRRLVGQGRLTSRRLAAWTFVLASDVEDLDRSSVRPAAE